ncbi:MAG TPA: LLM class F420-dependent oxidoreductase [Novosphingobium sp.]|nr:LLM class F420-dependent oxidoreductase [Novosphingobium sp.]
MVKLGVIYPQTELQGDPQAVRRIALEAEALGFDSLLAYDHVLGASHDRQPPLSGPYTEHHPFHDPLVMFGYLAAITERITLTTGVLILPQRQTALVARQAADVDLLSGGRLRLGVGLGWNPVEYEALGQDFTRRGARVEEQVDLLRRLWTEPLLDFSGRFDRIDRAALNPRPRRPIPVWMGGFVDAALRRAARMADGFIFADGAADAMAQITRLKDLLAEEGRPLEGFGLQCNMLKARSPEQVVEAVLRWRDAGGTDAAFATMGQGFTTIAAHLDHVRRVADALRAAGLLA